MHLNHMQTYSIWYDPSQTYLRIYLIRNLTVRNYTNIKMKELHTNVMSLMQSIKTDIFPNKQEGSRWGYKRLNPYLGPNCLPPQNQNKVRYSIKYSADSEDPAQRTLVALRSQFPLPVETSHQTGQTQIRWHSWCLLIWICTVCSNQYLNNM